MKKLLITLLCLALLACSSEDGVRLGYKPFTEQEILVNLADRLLRMRGIEVEPPLPCADTYECQDALLSGRIDAMVEYTGTGLAFRGGGAPEGDTFEALDRLYSPLGLNWLVPLGFGNAYVIVISARQAAAWNVRSLEALARVKKPLRFVCPMEFMHRPADGYGPLLRSLGIQTARKPRISEIPAQRLSMLANGDADVAVLYATDGVLSDPRFLVLKDTAGFFPDYQASFLVRGDLGKRRPEALAALSDLSGRVSGDTIREWNRRIDVLGERPESVARMGLEAILPDGGGEAGVIRRRVSLAVAVGEGLGGFEQRLLEALRVVFPARSISSSVQSDPIITAASGKARFAILDASDFFSGGQRDDRLAAIAVLGVRQLHLLSTTPTAPGLEGRIGIEPGGGLLTVLDEHLTAAAAQVQRFEDRAALLKALAGGTIDGAFILSESDPALAHASSSPKRLHLHGLPGSLRQDLLEAAPYARASRLAGWNTEQNEDPLESVAVQVVLASPVKPAGQATRGPAAAVRKGALPLSRRLARRLALQIDSGEAPDPVLPTYWTATLPDQVEPAGGVLTLNNLLNILALLFLAWLARLLIAPIEPEKSP